MATSSQLNALSRLKTQELLGFAAAGDGQAWEVIYGRYRMLLLVEATAQSRAWLRGDAEDVVQSAFLSAWDHIRNFEYQGEGSFRRWLSRIVVNRVMDRLRRREREQQEPPEGSAGERTQPTREEPPRAAARKEDELGVLAALSQLDAEQREAIVLRKFEGKSWDEVAEVLGVHESTARRTFRAGMGRLAKLLSAHRDTD